jgi:hypothetical protein
MSFSLKRGDDDISSTEVDAFIETTCESSFSLSEESTGLWDLGVMYSSATTEIKDVVELKDILIDDAAPDWAFLPAGQVTLEIHGGGYEQENIASVVLSNAANTISASQISWQDSRHLKATFEWDASDSTVSGTYDLVITETNGAIADLGDAFTITKTFVAVEPFVVPSIPNQTIVIEGKGIGDHAAKVLLVGPNRPWSTNPPSVETLEYSAERIDSDNASFMITNPLHSGFWQLRTLDEHGAVSAIYQFLLSGTFDLDISVPIPIIGYGHHMTILVSVENTGTLPISTPIRILENNLKFESDYPQNISLDPKESSTFAVDVVAYEETELPSGINEGGLIVSQTGDPSELLQALDELVAKIKGISVDTLEDVVKVVGHIVAPEDPYSDGVWLLIEEELLKKRLSPEGIEALRERVLETSYTVSDGLNDCLSLFAELDEKGGYLSELGRIAAVIGLPKAVQTVYKRNNVLQEAMQQEDQVLIGIAKSRLEIAKAQLALSIVGVSASPAGILLLAADWAFVYGDKNYGPRRRYLESLEQYAAAIDPNEKIEGHPSGAISKGKKLNYTIRFENLPEAKVPAQDIVITDDLDGDLDFSTLEWGPLSHPDSIAEMKLENGRLTWVFRDINLPPNRFPPEGQGYVSFKIRPKERTLSGVIIKNNARIIFDSNDPIKTNDAIVIYDFEAPEVNVDIEAVSLKSVRLNLDAHDEHTAINKLIAFVSQDGRPDEYIGELKKSGPLTFKGEKDKRYAFYALAYDQAGNQGLSTRTDEVEIEEVGCGCSTGVDPKENGALVVLMLCLLAIYLRSRKAP